MLEITIKKVPKILVASIKDSGRSADDFSKYFEKISKDVAFNKVKETGPLVMLRHNDSGYWEACVQIEKEYVSDNPKIEIKYLPEVKKMASFIHKGPWGRAMKPSMDNFFKWLKENNMKCRHPYREIYHSGERENTNWLTFVTELQFPIE